MRKKKRTAPAPSPLHARRTSTSRARPIIASSLLSSSSPVSRRCTRGGRAGSSRRAPTSAVCPGRRSRVAQPRRHHARHDPRRPARAPTAIRTPAPRISTRSRRTASSSSTRAPPRRSPCRPTRRCSPGAFRRSTACATTAATSSTTRRQTLAETLKARGYATGGFIAAYVLDSKWGIAQGFDTYFDDFDLSKYKVFSMGAIQRPGNEVVDQALPWIDQHRDRHAVLRLGPPLRRARAVQPAGAVQEPLSGRSLPGRDLVRRLAGRPRRPVPARSRSARPHRHRRHRRSRREPQRSRRGGARLLRLRERRARAADRCARRSRRCRAGASTDSVRSVDVMPTVLDLLGVPDAGGRADRRRERRRR